MGTGSLVKPLLRPLLHLHLHLLCGLLRPRWWACASAKRPTHGPPAKGTYPCPVCPDAQTKGASASVAEVNSSGCGQCGHIWHHREWLYRCPDGCRRSFSASVCFLARRAPGPASGARTRNRQHIRLIVALLLLPRMPWPCPRLLFLRCQLTTQRLHSQLPMDLRLS